MEVVGIYSLQGARALIQKRGHEEEVEVKVHKCKLMDVPELRAILREQIVERHWGVANLSRLRQFVKIDEAVGTAAETLIEVAREPRNQMVAAAKSRAHVIKTAAERLRRARMKWARGLGTLLLTVARVMDRGRRRPGLLEKLLLSARTRCAEVADREVTTVQVRTGAKLNRNYRNNL